MLILGRRTGEKVVLTIPPSPVAQVVTVTMAGIRGRSQGRIGFEATAGVRIDREEVHRRLVANGELPAVPGAA